MRASSEGSHRLSTFSIKEKLKLNVDEMIDISLDAHIKHRCEILVKKGIRV